MPVPNGHKVKYRELLFKNRQSADDLLSVLRLAYGGASTIGKLWASYDGLVNLNSLKGRSSPCGNIG